MLKGDIKRVQNVTQVLIEGYFSHSYPIGHQEARQLGLNVTEANSELWDVIWKLYLGYNELLKDKEGHVITRLKPSPHPFFYFPN